MIVKTLLVTIVYYLVSWLNIGLGIFHLNRPIVVAPLIGLVLGDLTTGIMLGATFEAVFLGVIAVGGAAPADATSGAVIGTAMAIMLGLDGETALSIAVPISILTLMVTMVTMNLIHPFLVVKMDKYAENNEPEKLTRLHWIMSFLMPLLGSIVIFLSLVLGVEAMGSVLQSIPPFLMQGFSAAAAMLPAVGFGLLLNMLFDKKIFAFYFLGFVLSIYLKLPTMAIAIIAIVIGVTFFFNSSTKNGQLVTEAVAGNVSLNDEEDFFDE